ncbi:HAMP domain-containing sensor histidine kinase [Chryseolinea sp. H1M3-3]|uniref:sensor histidine kinase n=1 Tax=Chryseolinea sp. H1M3-3 TaxID=3034144 RepID=UPI0023ECB76B|nr:HAMP domain-containing sensor histidine kinase [Chryseolinea sp. H1M3-3]
MKAPKKAIALCLMISSLLMLVVLQSLWLKNSYENAYHRLSRESFSLFSSTVLALRDSLFVRNIHVAPADSLRPPSLAQFHDSLFSIHGNSDTIKNLRIHIESVGPLDSGVNFLRPLASSLHRLKRREIFYINAGHNALNIDTLTNHFKKSLASSNIYLPFSVKHLEENNDQISQNKRLGRWNSLDETPQRPYNDSMIMRLRLDPMNNYLVVFPTIRAALLKEIAPQILFSVFLTSVIVVSFLMMYRSLRSQELLNIAKNDFISNVTHELKTPVATVSVALEALKNFQVLGNHERTIEYLEIAQGELNRLTLMTDKILKTSSFEANGISLIKEMVNLDTIVREVIAALKLAFEKNNVRVTYTPSGNNFQIMGNEMHLTNVAYNLLDNALKYGGKNTNLDVVLRESDGIIEFIVRDYGIGIPASYQKKIFEKFVRVPTGDIHNVKGYGLGLNYIDNVVKKLGGKIELESEVGKGSSFKIVLPK